MGCPSKPHLKEDLVVVPVALPLPCVHGGGAGEGRHQVRVEGLALAEAQEHGRQRRHSCMPPRRGEQVPVGVGQPKCAASFPALFDACAKEHSQNTLSASNSADCRCAGRSTCQARMTKGPVMSPSDGGMNIVCDENVGVGANPASVSLTRWAGCGSRGWTTEVA